MSSLEIKNLHVSTGDKEIVKGVTLAINTGEIHAVMGPNGAGKSTMAKAIAGHPDYTITQGDVLLDGKSILEMESDERARAGIFLAFQYPSEIPGVSIANFLRAAIQARMSEGEEIDASGFYKRLYQKMDLLKIERTFTSRAVNEGFSPRATSSLTASRSSRWNPTSAPARGSSSRSSTRARSPGSASPTSCARRSRPGCPRARRSTPPDSTSGSTRRWTCSRLSVPSPRGR